MLGRSLALISIIAAPALSQQATPSQHSATSYVRALWQEVRDYLIKAAADAPDSVFRYKPTPDVRSFGETFGEESGGMSYYQLAEDVLEDIDALRQWANKAIDVARRAKRKL